MKPFLTVLVALATGSFLCADQDPSFHFQYGLAPYLAKAGCAAADCHGGATGRGGLKLSLFATNARADFEAIAQDLGGRRIDLFDPEGSLILRKPTRQIRHKGGRVIEQESEAYQALLKWIQQGAHYSRGDLGELVDLELEMTSGPESEQVQVQATFQPKQGAPRREDVTAMARFETTDETVATVDEDGRIRRRGPGRAWIIANYGLLAARTEILEPFGPTAKVPPLAPSKIGRSWYHSLSDLGLASSARAGEYRILRRLYLDLTGRPPALDEIEAYFGIAAGDRVAITAKKLLASDQFADQLARHLMNWFEVPDASRDLRHTSERNTRLRNEVRRFAGRDTSLLDFAGAMFTQAGPREFVQRFGDPRDRAEFVGRTHLGISIGCARCHNHPSDRWTQAQHLQFSALFADPRPSSKGGKMTMKPGPFYLPGDGKAIEPALLPLGAMDEALSTEENHSEHLAAFLRTAGRPHLARNIANRFMGILVGRHLVEAPDDHRVGNPALHEPLLDELVQVLEKNDFRIRPFVQAIMESPFYQVESEPPVRESLSGDPQHRYLARREARALSSEEYLRAVSFVLGLEPPRDSKINTPLAQQLKVLNSGVLQKWLRTPGNQIDFLIEFGSDDLLKQLFLLILTRPPTAEERAVFGPILQQGNESTGVVRDLAFALLTSREFSSVR